MAEYYDTSAPETNKLWAKRLWSHYRQSDQVLNPKHSFVGTDPNSNAFVMIDDMQRSVGDEVTLTISYHFAPSPGVIGDEIIEGKLDSIDTATFKMKIDLQRHGWKSRGVMNGQRVKIDTIEESKSKVGDKWKTSRAVAVINHLCGNSTQNQLGFTGLNTVAEPDDQHIYRVGTGLGGNDETVQADSTLTLDFDVIDELVTLAETADVPIAPFAYKGEDYYGLYIHPFVMADLRQKHTQWYDIMVKALQGGLAKDNPLFSRAAGMWRKTLIFVEPYITRGSHHTTLAKLDNTRRCVFFGAGALAFAYGRVNRGDHNHFYWFNSTWDHGSKYEGSASLVWGTKGIRFSRNGTVRDYGKIVVTAYSADRRTGYADLGQTYNNGLG